MGKLKTVAKPSSKTEQITCLSLQQPYADDVFFGGKWCENRSWPTDFRGELWIHASKIAPGLDADEVAGLKAESPTGMMTGHILGRVNLVSCVPSDVLFSIASDEVCKILGLDPSDRPAFDSSNPESTSLKRLLADIDPESWDHFCLDKFAWIFTEPDMLDEPIPISGQLRLWTAEVESAALTLASNRKRKWRTKPN